MILTALIIGATIATGVSLVTKYWEKFHSWVKRAIDTVKDLVKSIVYGVTVFIRKIGEAIKEISKHYTKKQNQWEETVVTRKVDASEVPEEIRNRASASYDTDITKDYELVLQS